MWMRQRESDMSRLSGMLTCSSSQMFALILSVAVSSNIIAGTSAESGEPSSLHNLRLLSSTQQLHHDNTVSPPNPSMISSSLTTATGSGEVEQFKNRKVREIPRNIGEDELSSSSASDYNQQRQVLASAKLKGLYPTLSGSGELFRLFRPLALSSDKTIGMSRWYLPGFGYFSRGGRAASSNFIRFGRSGSGSSKFMEDEDGTNEGDVTMLSRNSAKKKNNFIRLGRENPRQTNFIRLGRSGPPSSSPSGEYYMPGYITPALSDSFRDDEDDRHEFN